MWLGCVWKHVDGHGEIDLSLHLLRDGESVFEALVVLLIAGAVTRKKRVQKGHTFNCIHKIAGSFLILSCLVAFCGVPPHPLQLYTPAISFSGEVKLSRQPVNVGVVEDPCPPSARFFACT